MEHTQKIITEEPQSHETPIKPKYLWIQSLEQEKILEYKLANLKSDPQVLKQLIQFQFILFSRLPRMPREYITKTLFEEKQKNLLMIMNGQIIGGICFRIFKQKQLVQIVFLAMKKESQGQGFGGRLMAVLKDYLKNKHLKTIMTFADNLAIRFFKKQGFSTQITLRNQIWEDYIKVYSGSTMMQYSIAWRMNYLETDSNIQEQKKFVHKQIKQICIEKTRLGANIQKYIKSRLLNEEQKQNLLRKMVQKLPGFQQISKVPDDGIESNGLESKVSIHQQCKDLLYEILNHPAAQNFQLSHSFFKNTFSIQKSLQEKTTLKEIWKNLQHFSEQNLESFFRDLNSFASTLDLCDSKSRKIKGAAEFRKFIENKIENLRQTAKLSKINLSSSKQEQITKHTS